MLAKYCAQTTAWLENAFHIHDDVIKWKHFPRYWPFLRGIHWWPVNSPHKGHWRGALMLSLICAWTNNWVNNRDAGNLRRHDTHYDVAVMTGPCERNPTPHEKYIRYIFFERPVIPSFVVFFVVSLNKLSNKHSRDLSRMKLVGHNWKSYWHWHHPAMWK